MSRVELRGVLHALRNRGVGGRLVTVLDSEYVFKGITEWSVKWERHGWRSRGKGIGLGPRDLWQEIWQLRRAAGSHVVVLWTPSHLNVKGNDEADALAEAGRAQHPHNKRRRQEEPAWSALGLSPMCSEFACFLGLQSRSSFGGYPLC